MTFFEIFSKKLLTISAHCGILLGHQNETGKCFKNNFKKLKFSIDKPFKLWYHNQVACEGRKSHRAGAHLVFEK